jgi:hypothetical protein
MIYSKAFLAMAVCGVLAGCGSVTSTNSDGGVDVAGKDLQTFIGTWTLGSGTTMQTCAGVVTTQQVTTDVVWQAGTTSDLIQPADSAASGCDLLANVSGKVATALPGQSCGKMGTNLMISMYTFTVAASGTSATESSSGTRVVSTAGVGMTCTYTETATYTKSP